MALDIFNKNTLTFHNFEISSLLKLLKGHIIMKSMSTTIPLVEFDICLLG